MGMAILTAGSPTGSFQVGIAIDYGHFWFGVDKHVQSEGISCLGEGITTVLFGSSFKQN